MLHVRDAEYTLTKGPPIPAERRERSLCEPHAAVSLFAVGMLGESSRAKVRLSNSWRSIGLLKIRGLNYP